MSSNLDKLVKQVITETAKINFVGHEFILKTDVNEDPNKKGVKIQFLPTTFGSMTPTEQNDIAIELEQRLEKGLAEYDLRVERDRNLKDKTIIGFFIYIEYFDKIIRSALSSQNPSKQEDKIKINKKQTLVKEKLNILKPRRNRKQRIQKLKENILKKKQYKKLLNT